MPASGPSRLAGRNHTVSSRVVNRQPQGLPKNFIGVDQIWASVQATPRRLTISERRRVLVYLAELGELSLRTNYELARMFGVSETMIRHDRKRMQISLGEELTADNALALIAEHHAELNGLIRAAYQGLNSTDKGGLTHRNYLDSLGKLLAQRFSNLQEIGIVRKELGHMAVTSEDWVAKISSEMIASVGLAQPADSEDANDDE